MKRAFATVTLLVAATCGGTDTRTVDVLAASSLTDAFDELAERFEAANPGVTIRLQFGGSSSLAALVADGGPGEVFASADERTMQRVVAADRIEGEPRVFGTNQLTLVVPTGNPAGVGGIDDLARPQLVIGVCAPQVPCGALAEMLFADAGLEVRADTLEPSVRSVLTKAELGEIDVGVVYRTDALAGAERVDEIALAESPANEYSIAALRGSSPDARRFVDFVGSDEAQAVLADFGFGTP